jgi:hypothetical protein
MCVLCMLYFDASQAELAVPTPQLTLNNEHVPLALDDNFVLPIAGACAAAIVFTILNLPDCTPLQYILR